ncbi:S-adenosyl-L-methionine-dependent methyltransferase [Mycena albidolilacea]|uniref:S-adenosyl-L-methionine-dependent methyltransferase n=1 Tax=Mycena albidolilacea TaxID=1033008 RepID=A0AAD6ZAT5_9AGAR|nr:S-adenosyl-L-methionine-dependent methyltransferase [Mycena albidolilacea]
MSSSNPPPQAHDAARLDAQHEAFTQYFDGKLGIAPLDGLRPSKIIELGCGSGAWAIQAAVQFPDAQIVAVDRAPPPEGILPPTVTFQLADLTKDLKFDAETFDIVHARSVLIHVANAESVLRRASRLVKPGGLLLIEEADVLSFGNSGGSATRRFIGKVKEIQDSLGADVEFGRKVEGIVGALGTFEEVHVEKISLPFGGNGPDKALNQLGLGMKQSLATASGPLAKRFSDRGLTEEVAREYNEEQERSDNESAMDFYLCWARRSLE